jgi:hypothetical protein
VITDIFRRPAPIIEAMIGGTITPHPPAHSVAS